MHVESRRASAPASALGLVAVLVAAGCEARVSLGARCTGPADCPAELRCVASRCRAVCTTASDCEDGRRCLRGPDGVNACSTAPDDSCTGVEDCGDPLFSRCVASECQTVCVEDAECAGGDCVLGGCVERAGLDPSELGAVAGVGPGGSAVVVGSFLVPDPGAPERALTLPYDPGFADVAVVVEDGPAAGAWTAHLPTMQRLRSASGRLDIGVPMRVDVSFVGTSPSSASVEVFEDVGDGVTSVAAEPMGDGRAALLWMIEVPDEESSPLNPGLFAFYARGVEAPLTMSHDNYTQRFPAHAHIARGLGEGEDGPGWGLRVVDGSRSELQVLGPMGGGGSETPIPVEGTGPVDVEATERALLYRDEGRSVRFVRLLGPELLSHAAFDLDLGSSCAPGLTDRFVVARANYVAATCEGPTVSLTRIACPSDESRSLEPCTITPWLSVTEPEAPSRVSLETWPGGVVLVTHDTQGAHVRPLSDEASTASAASSPRVTAVLPSSYRVDASTDFRLVRAVSNAADRPGAAVVVVSGLYQHANDVAQLRLGVVEVSAAP